MKKYQNYETINSLYINELKAEGTLLKHSKSGARVLLLKNDDVNKTFTIGFCTTPDNNKGIPHIIEHSVLCGSRKYPAKEPFVELMKSSLNTFLNAMTFPDKTLYPVASCNKKDFYNLMDVYLDAVFYPNIYDKKEIFMQEGWHFELKDKQSELIYNGIVYNEMKGVFSSADSLMQYASFSSLFPDTTYGVESGGNPDFIPDLSQEEFLTFHQKFYHPSNSFIVIYGDVDMEERLQYIDQEYLSKFNKIDIPSKIEFQKPFTEKVFKEFSYPVGKEETLKNKTYLSYNMTINNALDTKLWISFEILEFLLLEVEGAPLRQALLDAKIGNDVIGYYDGGVLQPILSITSKNANSDEVNNFVDVIESTLKKIVKNGLDKETLKGVINRFEFKYREADFGQYPKGIIYTMESFNSWLYDEKQPFSRLLTNELFSFLKEKINTNYFEKLIEKYILNNNHKAIVVVKPDNLLGEKKEQLLKKKLVDYKNSLSEIELTRIIEETTSLKEYQSTPSTEEELRNIPLLRREDLSKDILPIKNEVINMGKYKVIYHDEFTNGINYIDTLFLIDTLNKDELLYLGILKTVLGRMDTKNYSFQTLDNEININSGGINFSLNINTYSSKQAACYFVSNASVLNNNTEFVYKMIEEIINNTSFDNTKRLQELLAEKLSMMQSSFSSQGHRVSFTRSLSQDNLGYYLNDATNGIDFYLKLNELMEHFDTRKEETVKQLNDIRNKIFGINKLLINITSPIEEKERMINYTNSFANKFNEISIPNYIIQINHQPLKEGLLTPFNVQYVARSGDFNKEGLPYKGSIKVLKNIISLDYLWVNVRVKGGAYGGMCSFSSNGICSFVSYRDPNLKETNQIYDEIPSFVKNFKASEEEMTRYIIGTIGELDTPLTPRQKGIRFLNDYFYNHTNEFYQKERNEILTATQEDINNLLPYITTVLSDGNLCVIGNENKIKENSNMFECIFKLFK